MNSSLVQTLESIVEVLRRYGENKWAARLEEDLFFIRKRDAYGAKRFRTHFGGMGSLQDLIVCPENGHAIAPENVANVNGELTTLLSKAYELATTFPDGDG